MSDASALPIERAEANRAPAAADYALGPILVSEVAFGGSAGVPPLKPAGGAGDLRYAFVLLESGRAALHHYGHQATLGAGDLVLIDGAAPCDFQPEAPGTLTLLQVSQRLLRSYLPSPQPMCGQPLRTAGGMAESLAGIVRGIIAQFGIGEFGAGFEPHFRNRIARNLLDVLATAFSIDQEGGLSGSPVVNDRHARVRLYLERNLRDPELKPATIATQLRISPRYLRVVFAASGEKLSAYILRRRIEECARELADDALRHVPITEIAFSWGFNSGAHFTRCFRQQLGASPSEYRRGRRSGPVVGGPGIRGELAP